MWNLIEKIIDTDFGTGVTREVRGNLIPVMIEQGDHSNICLVPPDWMGRIDLGRGGFSIHSLGLRLGSLANGRLDLSLVAAERIARITDRALTVSKRGAEAFTYGKSILRESVVSLTSGILRGQRVIVLDEHGVCLGVATLSVDASRLNRLSAKELVAKNLIDIGSYIRQHV